MRFSWALSFECIFDENFRILEIYDKLWKILSRFSFKFIISLLNALIIGFNTSWNLILILKLNCLTLGTKFVLFLME